MKPYQHKNNIRTFSKDVNPLDLIWHQDEYDRIVEVISGEGWKFQRDNELPLALTEKKRIFIPKHQIHRVIKGNTDLVIKITELKKSNIKQLVKEVLQENKFQIAHSEEVIKRFEPIMRLAEKFPQLYISKSDLQNPNTDSIGFSIRLNRSRYEPDMIRGEYFINLPYNGKRWYLLYDKTNPSGRRGGTYKDTDNDNWVYNYIKKYIKKAIQNGVKHSTDYD